MRPALYDAAALFGRVALGATFIQHGWAKARGGIDATTQVMTQAGVPAPRASAWFATVAELGGGIMLVLGLLTAVAGAMLFAVMSGAFLFVHVKDGSFELVTALGAVAVMLAVAGPGRISLDRYVFRR